MTGYKITVFTRNGFTSDDITKKLKKEGYVDAIFVEEVTVISSILFNERLEAIAQMLLADTDISTKILAKALKSLDLLTLDLLENEFRDARRRKKMFKF
jgi:redox-regulated HSP33 family molecular chaperone